MFNPEPQLATSDAFGKEQKSITQSKTVYGALSSWLIAMVVIFSPAVFSKKPVSELDFMAGAGLTFTCIQTIVARYNATKLLYTPKGMIGRDPQV